MKSSDDVDRFNDLQAFTMEETSRRSTICRSTLYQMIRDGSLPSIKRGRRRLIPASALRDLILGEAA